jgi:hypothetical protein
MRRFARSARVVFGLALGLAATSEAAAAGQTVLETDSHWRAFVMCGDPQVPLALLREKDPKATAGRGFGVTRELHTPPAPAGWAAPDFDDAYWRRYPGPFHGRVNGWYHYRGIRALLAVRGRFAVTDPSRVRRLALSLTYRGGVVVYLNGTEVARRDLPEGALTPQTEAAPYPKDAYVDPAGRIVYHRTDKAAREAAERLRVRSLGPLVLRTEPLRKGVNVLAVEVHRSAFRPEALRWTRRTTLGWSHVGLHSIRLTVDGEGAIVPNTSRPKGLQVWNQDIHAVFDVAAYGDPNEPLRPIRLAGARNGSYSGQVVVSADTPFERLAATMSDLTRADGDGRIAASAVQVRYPQLSALGITADYLPDRRSARSAPAFLPLTPTPPGKAAVQPVWITLHVPRDAPAGSYRGTLTVSVKGRSPVVVPVELEVAGWTLPDARGFGTFMGFYQSPESVAMQYKVPLWSERHWALLARSFQWAGYLGSNLLIVPLVCRTQFGNDECMVPWRRRADGTYAFDFTVFDRYLALAAKHCRLDVISCQVWTPYGGGYHLPHRLPSKPTFVTVVDPKTGRREAMKLPAFGTEQSARLWKPYIDAVRARLREQGLEKSMVLGIHSDSFMTAEVTQQFAQIAPGLPWHKGAHGRGGPRGRGFRYAYREYLYVPMTIGPPAARKSLGWNLPERVVISQRLYDPWQPPMTIRTLPERALLLGERGAGRMCLDYWPVGPDRSNDGRVLFNRWPDSSSCQRRPFIRWLLLPGDDGAIGTIKVEALREGLQVAEVRIFLEKALQRGGLPAALAERVRDALDRQAALCRAVHCGGAYGVAEPVRVTRDVGWQGLSAKLYQLAAEVAR